ncbi:MAG TPA: PVC-type heme-binding CxxCH protein [Pirellulaceae bacterium]|jgi:putative membrane-bound dehydrogenase-like protein|nr:PVC-type heme-binding CxxCH protein [Pirellulaceae bacterium]
MSTHSIRAFRATAFASLVALFPAVCFAVEPSADEDDFPKLVNSQKPGEEPPTPEEATEKITAPEGFHVTLFAGEPDVAQPIGMNLDVRNRLWVAECYVYARPRWQTEFRDRIVILEDTDNDGRHDVRTVFWDQGSKLTSVLPDVHGAWVLDDGCLKFIPDANRDDVPDAEPKVLLDGFEKEHVGHNIVNGLMFGPDGWIYGRHGIQATSSVGAPGTSAEERTELNCCIWRYHPERKEFDVVAEGTTNPWGLDYDDRGEFFFTNNVTGHLWHAIPGAYFKRMYGEHLRGHLYELMDQTADHYHWDRSKGDWTSSRLTEGSTDELGGGHSHCGGMIYLGDRFPAKYRGSMFMCNTHGRRINVDRLVRTPAGYVGVHDDDFFFANQPWFRGISILQDADGNILVSDWTDLGECHDDDGVHRTSGRGYKVAYGEAPPARKIDLAKLSTDELVAMTDDANEWNVRMARVVLHRRSQEHDPSISEARSDLKKLFAENDRVETKLRALWALQMTGGVPAEMLPQCLAAEDESLRIWALRLQEEATRARTADPSQIGQDVVFAVTVGELARQEKSLFVRKYLAAMLRYFDAPMRLNVAEELIDEPDDRLNHDLTLLVWYAIEPAVAEEPKLAGELAIRTPSNLLRRFVSRRLANELREGEEPGQALVQLLTRTSGEDREAALLGIAEGLEGWASAPKPAGWEALAAKIEKDATDEEHAALKDLAVLFGDGRAKAELLKIVADSKADGQARREALKLLAETQTPELSDLLGNLVNDRMTSLEAVKALARYECPDAPGRILGVWGRTAEIDRAVLLDTLVSRASYAKGLLDAIEGGRIPAEALSASQARQIASLGDDSLIERLERVWGRVSASSEEKEAAMNAWSDRLAPETIAEANRSTGRELFVQRCANCHKLWGEGEAVGPDLTGSNRKQLAYLLENVLDPSAVVPNPYRMTLFVLDDGRTISGVVSSETKEAVRIRTANEEVVVPTASIEQRKLTTLSLMPENLFENLNETQVRDLTAYFQGDGPAPLPNAVDEPDRTR